MGDEVEAAIYNDGRKAPEELRKYVEQQMRRLMSNKLNEHNIKLKSEDFEQNDKLNLDELIDKNKLLL
jgi:hypothetical protein